MPTAVQFREAEERSYNARTRTGLTEFALDDNKKEWLRGMWRQAVDAQFAQAQSYEPGYEVGSNVLVVQGFLVDVVSRIPPDAVGSDFTLVTDPWEASIVLELRDATTTELLARTMDRSTGKGQMTTGTVWILTDALVERWALRLSDRLKEISDLGRRGQGRETPTWAR